MTIPKYTKGILPLVAKKKGGQPLKAQLDALDNPRSDTTDLFRSMIERMKCGRSKPAKLTRTRSFGFTENFQLPVFDLTLA